MIVCQKSVAYDLRFCSNFYQIYENPSEPMDDCKRTKRFTRDAQIEEKNHLDNRKNEASAQTDLVH